MIWWRRVCDVATLKLLSYRSTVERGRREEKKRQKKLWMLLRCYKLDIRGIFSFTASLSWAIFIRSLCFVSINLTVLNCARASRKKTYKIEYCRGFGFRSTPQKITSEGRFRLSSERDFNNVQLSIGYGVHLLSPPVSISLFPNYVWPFTFPAKLALLFNFSFAFKKFKSAIFFLNFFDSKFYFFLHCIAFGLFIADLSLLISSKLFRALYLRFKILSLIVKDTTSEKTWPIDLWYPNLHRRSWNSEASNFE